MNIRAFLALAAATVIAVVVAGFVVFGRDEGPAARAPGSPLLPELARTVDNVTRIVWSRAGETATVKKAGDRWVVEQFFDYPANAEQVRTALVDLARLQTSEPKTRNPALYDKLDVGAPSAEAKSTLIELFDASGKKVGELIVGRIKSAMPGRESVYVRLPTEPRAWLATGRADLPYNRAGWVNTEVVTIDLPRVREAVLNAPAKGPRIRVFKTEPRERDYTIEGMPEDHEIKDIFGAEDIARVVQQLTFEDVRPAAKVQPDLTARPFAEFATFDGLKIDLWLTEAEGRAWASLRARPQDGNTDEAIAKEAAAINDRVGAWAYGLPSYEMGNLRKTMDDLIQKKPGA